MISLLAALPLASRVWGAELMVVGLMNGSQLALESSSVRQSSDAILGVGFGASYEWWLYPLNNAPSLTLETGVLYVNREIGFFPETDTITQLQFTAIFRRKWRFLSAGVGSYLATSLGNIESSTQGSIPYDESGIKPLDFGWIGALGFHISPFGRYNQNGRPNLVVEARYLKSLADVSSDPAAEKKFTEVQLMAGIRWCLGGTVLACSPIQ